MSAFFHYSIFLFQYENEETFVERVEFGESGVTVVLLFCYPLVEQLIAVAGYLQQGTPFRTVQLLYHTEPISVDYHLSTLAFIHPFFEGYFLLSLWRTGCLCILLC